MSLEQLEMLNEPAAALSFETQTEIARRCTSRSHAQRKCIQVSNLESKQIFQPLQINQGIWSKVVNGQAYLDPDKAYRLWDLCGNEIPLIYDAFARGYELTPLRQPLERENAKLKTELEQERMINRRLGEMLSGR